MAPKKERTPVPGHPSIFKVKTGFKVDLYLKDPETRKYQRRIRKTFPSLGEAVEFKRKTQAEHTLGVLAKRPADKPTLGDVAKIKLAMSEDCKTFNHIQRNLGRILDYFGENTLIENIDEIAVRGWINALRKRKTKTGKLWAPKTVWNNYITLRSLFKIAREKGFVVATPNISVKKECGQRKPVPMEDFIKVLDHVPASPEPHKAWLLMAFFTGQRHDDLRTMKWEQVQEEVIFYRSSKTERNHMAIPDPPAELVEALSGLEGPRKPDRFVFAKPESDQPYDKKTMIRHVKEACDRAGVPRFTPHQIRHLATTAGLERMDSGIVEKWIGWTSPDMIKNHYGHVGRQIRTLMQGLQEEMQGIREALVEKEEEKHRSELPNNVVLFQKRA